MTISLRWMAMWYMAAPVRDISRDILSGVPYVDIRRRSGGALGGAAGLLAGDRLADPLHQILVEQRLEQEILDTHGGGACRQPVVVMTGDQNHGRSHTLVAQPLGKLDTVEVRHLVVDDETVDESVIRRVEQGNPAAKGADVEAVGLQQESQRAEDVSVVVGYVDPGFCVNRHGSCRETSC